HAPRFADRVIGSRTSGDDAHIRAAQSEFHRDNAAGHVADQHWNGEGGDALRPFVHNALNWSSSVFSPPMPLLTITPKRSRLTFSRSRPLSRIDILAAAIDN